MQKPTEDGNRHMTLLQTWVLRQICRRLYQKTVNMEKFFNSLSKTNQYAINWRLQTAKKPETREKRMKLILEMLAKGEKFH